MSARPWYGFAGLLLSAIMFASPQARADDTTTLPPVVITGTATTTEGQTIYCFTPACEEIIEFNTQQFDGTFETISQGNGGAVDKDTFCANMAGNKPPGCDVSAPPSMPGFDAGWVGNGCGDGSFASIVADALVGMIVSNYDGDLDHPFPGVSFYPACQAHDRCYATRGSSKATCDGTLGSNLGSVCSSASSTYQGACQLLRQVYVDVVTLKGGDPFNAAQGEADCAAWASEMEVDQCTEDE